LPQKNGFVQWTQPPKNQVIGWPTPALASMSKSQLQVYNKVTLTLTTVDGTNNAIDMFVRIVVFILVSS
jgi:DsbC/DsbD-like thiol-disulfide interchange protein